MTTENRDQIVAQLRKKQRDAECAIKTADTVPWINPEVGITFFVEKNVYKELADIFSTLRTE